MLIVFFDYDGVVHHEYALRGQAINKEFYLEVLKRSYDAVRRKRPCFYESGDWLIHHDNASAHSGNLVQQFLQNRTLQNFASLHTIPTFGCSQN